MRCGRLAAALWVVVVLCAFGACQRDQAKAQASSPAPVSAAEDAGARFTLTRDQVDRFVKYQERLVALYDQVLKDRDKEKVAPIRQLADGGVADPVKASLQLFQGKAKAEEAARAEAGLSLEDVRRIEPVVAEVINERGNARGEDIEGALKQYEAMRDKLPEDQRKPVEEQIQDLRADHAHRFGNVDQRQKYGDASVDAVLSRESDLARLRTEWVKRIAALSH